MVHVLFSISEILVIKYSFILPKLPRFPFEVLASHLPGLLRGRHLSPSLSQFTLPPRFLYCRFQVAYIGCFYSWKQLMIFYILKNKIAFVLCMQTILVMQSRIGLPSTMVCHLWKNLCSRILLQRITSHNVPAPNLISTLAYYFSRIFRARFFAFYLRKLSLFR